MVNRKDTDGKPRPLPLQQPRGSGLKTAAMASRFGDVEYTGSMSTAKSRVCAIIANYNRAKDTLDCVNSVFSSTYGNVTVVVVDNGSTEEERRLLATSLDKRAHLIEVGRNTGVAGAWNLGLALAKKDIGCEFMILLNNDTLVDESVIEELVRAADECQEGGVFGPNVIDERFTTPPARLDDGPHVKMTVSHQLPGCAFMVRSTVFDEVGGFDEQYFAYGEEMDFFERVRNSCWLSLKVNTRGVVHHKGSSTASMMTGFEAFYRSRNALVFAGKNLKGWRLIHFLSMRFLRYQAWGIVRDLRSDAPKSALFPRIRGTIIGGFLFLRIATTCRSLQSPTQPASRKQRVRQN